MSYIAIYYIFLYCTSEVYIIWIGVRKNKFSALMGSDEEEDSD